MEKVFAIFTIEDQFDTAAIDEYTKTTLSSYIRHLIRRLLIYDSSFIGKEITLKLLPYYTLNKSNKHNFHIIHVPVIITGVALDVLRLAVDYADMNLSTGLLALLDLDEMDVSNAHIIKFNLR